MALARAVRVSMKQLNVLCLVLLGLLMPGHDAADAATEDSTFYGMSGRRNGFASLYDSGNLMEVDDEEGFEDWGDDDSGDDVISMIGTSIEVTPVQRKILNNLLPVSNVDSASFSAMAPSSSEVAAIDGTIPSWEAKFNWGLYHSKLAMESTTASTKWMLDTIFSDTAVPTQMVHAEELLLSAMDTMPQELQHSKTAERALRIYNHAKWLAERSYLKAAEWRYREAAKLAKSCRRKVLAGHALSRLGYFLMHSKRHEEARQILAESDAISKKSNPLAPFLLGVIDRGSAGSDAEKLRSAEDRILSAAEQPSEELEADRVRLSNEIRFWREAEGSPSKCMTATDTAYMLICFVGQTFFSPKRPGLLY